MSQSPEHSPLTAWAATSACMANGASGLVTIIMYIVIKITAITL